MLLRYTDVWDMEKQIKQISKRLENTKGISIKEFKSFFFFLNNLEGFATAVHYFALANQPIGKGKKYKFHIRRRLKRGTK
jgi:hypothetical protein